MEADQRGTDQSSQSSKKTNGKNWLSVYDLTKFDFEYFLCSLKNKKTSDLNDILFTKFKTNYNNEPEIYRKGTLMFKVSDPFKKYFTSF